MSTLCLLAFAIQSVAPSPAQVPSATAAGHSSQAALSSNGEWVVFCSTASDLVAGDTDGAADIFLRSRKSGTTVRISDNDVFTAQHPAISGNGRWVAYWQSFLEEPRAVAQGLSWRLVLHDTLSRTSSVLDGRLGGARRTKSPEPASLSFDGARVAYVAMHEGNSRALVYDRSRGVSACASVSSEGVPSELAVWDASISSSGRFLVFSSPSVQVAKPQLPPDGAPFAFTPDHQHIFLRDLTLRTTQYVSDRALKVTSYPNFGSPRVSEDGRFVAYNHYDPRKMGCPNVGFITDVHENRAGRLIAGAWGDEFDGALEIRWLSRDGTRAIVVSCLQGLDLLAAPTERVSFYRYERGTRRFRRIEHAALDAAAEDDYPYFAVSEDGQTAVIATANSALVPNDLNEALDVFSVSLVDGSVELISVAARQ